MNANIHFILSELIYFWYNSVEMPNRMEKIDEIVKREVAQSIFELFPGQIISVTATDVSKDLSYAKIWLRSIGNIEYILTECQEQSREITRRLAQKLKTRRVPKLTFLADKSAEKVDRIEELLNQIHHETKERNN